MLTLWLAIALVQRIYTDYRGRPVLVLGPALSRLVARMLGYPRTERYTVDVWRNLYWTEPQESYRSTYRVGDAEFPYGQEHVGPITLWVWSYPPTIV